MRSICKKCKKYRKYLIDRICPACYYGYEPNYIKCIKCGNIRPHRAKMMCYSCYKVYGTPEIICKGCGKLKNHKGKGYCNNCFNKKFHYNQIKAHNANKYHNISFELYKKLTSHCILCDFNKMIDLHHIDHNHKNNSPSNLIGLCPNHHKMIHNELFSEEIKQELNKKLERLKYQET
jgi:hypothetical protein